MISVRMGAVDYELRIFGFLQFAAVIPGIPAQTGNDLMQRRVHVVP